MLGKRRAQTSEGQGIMGNMRPASITKERKTSTNVDFEKDSYSDNDHRLQSHEYEMPHGHRAELDEPRGRHRRGEGRVCARLRPESQHDNYNSVGHENQDEMENKTVNFVSTGAQAQCQTKGRGKTKFDGMCWNCGQTGHRSRECWLRGKGTSKGKGKKAWSKGKCKGANVFGTQVNHGIDRQNQILSSITRNSPPQPFAPQPQPVITVHCNDVEHRAGDVRRPQLVRSPVVQPLLSARRGR